MKGQSMLSMLQKIILLEMACLDMEAKLSTSCRMVKAMSFLSYQWAMSNFYLHQVFCQDDGKLAWYCSGIVASGNSDWRIRWKEGASEAWPSCDYQIICLVDSSFHFDSLGLSYDLHNQTIVTRLVNWFVHIHTHQLSQTMKLFNPFTATFAAMCPNSISNSELFFEIALAIQPT